MSAKEVTAAPEKKKKESILDLTRLVDPKVHFIFDHNHIQYENLNVIYAILGTWRKP